MAQSIKENIIEKVTFGAGCFWCVEAVFERLDGVVDVKVGYAGGDTENPTYEDVCTGNTGHVEVIQIVFDPKSISLERLLEVFWMSHDPTTLNRQGADVGTQYRSGIYYHNEKQRDIAEKSRFFIDKSGLYKTPIVTEVLALKTFYTAENYHQDYFRLNPDAPYCKVIIKPKLKKLFKTE